jgi:WD40 repeat protein
VVVSGGYEGTVRLWDCITGECVDHTQHGGVINSCALMPDRRHVLIAGGGKLGQSEPFLFLWDLNRSEKVRVFSGLEWSVTTSAVSANSHVVVGGDFRGNVGAWNLDTGQPIKRVKLHQSWVVDCALSPDGRFVLTVSGDSTCRLLDLQTQRAQEIPVPNPTLGVFHCDFAPDGKSILFGSGGFLVQYDLSAKAILRTFPSSGSWISSCAFSPDGELVVGGYDDGTLKIFHATRTPETSSARARHGEITGCSFSRSGKHVLTSSVNGQLKIWDVQSRRTLRSLRAKSAVYNSALSPDGRFALGAGSDGKLRLWDMSTGSAAHTFRGHEDSVDKCRFSPDGRFALSASSDGTLGLWETSSARLVRQFRGHRDAVSDCAFSPDTSKVASGSFDNDLRIWETTSGDCLSTLSGHTNTVHCVRFSPSSDAVLSASDDRTLKLWSLKTGECTRTFEGHTDAIWWCEFSPDGMYVLSASDDHTLRLWDIHSADVRAIWFADTKVTCFAVCSAPLTRAVIAGDAIGNVHFLHLHLP